MTNTDTLDLDALERAAENMPDGPVYQEIMSDRRYSAADDPVGRDVFGLVVGLYDTWSERDALGRYLAALDKPTARALLALARRGQRAEELRAATDKTWYAIQLTTPAAPIVAMFAHERIAEKHAKGHYDDWEYRIVPVSAAALSAPDHA